MSTRNTREIANIRSREVKARQALEDITGLNLGNASVEDMLTVCKYVRVSAPTGEQLVALLALRADAKASK
jgi:hypothetical protein